MVWGAKVAGGQQRGGGKGAIASPRRSVEEKLFALRESRRGTWRQALRGLEAQKLSGYAVQL